MVSERNGREGCSRVIAGAVAAAAAVVVVVCVIVVGGPHDGGGAGALTGDNPRRRGSEARFTTRAGIIVQGAARRSDGAIAARHSRSCWVG
jgi:hypothetical protein